uniref:MAT1-2-1 n=1 Tax=Stagonosporopsis cucurbitacearum TaxID=749889 RepID=A0A1S5YDV4_9PLEO|nr:MAT1-2-1 [Stagonosporopsis cucurbitacearum]AQP26325.1 MAT1-2-1 [Stagonosporopsis cucurbitacearum]AQQ80196.1 MAT1-2-1 [Stagonosporopsis cucurbitacearum]
MPFTTVDGDTMVQFHSALDACICSWLRGDTVVLLQGNIQELFGDMSMRYFEQSLIEKVGQAVTFTFSPNSNGGQTIVQMPKNTNVLLHHQSSASPPSEPAEAPTRLRKASPGIKKAPRPMNCWIIFREAMHKVLKAENPHLTVQEICYSLLGDLARSLFCREEAVAGSSEVSEGRTFACPP